jgi:hypothetical protein
MIYVAVYEAIALALFLWCLWDSWRKADQEDTWGDATKVLAALVIAWPLFVVLFAVWLLQQNWDTPLWSPPKSP